ncbi:MAG: hypothetical protein JXA96_17135 [Sedimentisphaerales bacterium]|nr:hypothetical protein [Sedimentisphaerales bacterium]
MFGKKKNKTTLIGQRDNIRDAIKKAMSNNNFDEIEIFERKLEKVERKMK